MGNFVGYVLLFFAILLLRYFATAGIFHIYYMRIKIGEADKILSQRPIRNNQIRKEIYWSIISSAIFAIFGAVTYWLWEQNFTLIYLDPNYYGLWYLPFSLVVILLLHETYYYWLHRAMHLPKIFRIVHKVHHQSISTTPWTAFSFHPWESIFEAMIVPIILMIVPVNVFVLLFYLIFMTISSVINHLDIEVYSDAFRNSVFGKLWIGATHHHFHHKEFSTNYGLYFTFWDRLMGTESRRMN